MSIQFNDTTNYRGLVQEYEKECGFNYGDVSGDSDLLKEFTSQTNIALDDFTELAIKSTGTWQWDDSSQYETDGTTERDYPIIKRNIVSGIRDYPFIDDENGNLILDIYKVMVADPSGVYREMKMVDQMRPNSSLNPVTSFVDGQNTTGTPSKVDLTANGIILDLVPNYNYTNGIKLFINREGSYFNTTDTTKKAGIPGIFHKYLYLKPALNYARRNDLKNFSKIEAAVIELEGSERLGITGKIQSYFSMRPKYEPRRMSPNVESNR